jgi:hypothetical protein
VFVQPRVLECPTNQSVQAQREGVAAIHVAGVHESIHEPTDVVEQPFMIGLMIRIRIIMLIALKSALRGQKGR